MRGYIGITYHRVLTSADASSQLDSGLLVLRHIVKGDTGHTAVRLCDEMEGAFVELAKVHISATRTAPAADDVDGAAAGDDEDAVARAMAAAALSNVLAITTDGGANMCRGAALLMQRHQKNSLPISRERLCICHTLQLLVRGACASRLALLTAPRFAPLLSE